MSEGEPAFCPPASWTVEALRQAGFRTPKWCGGGATALWWSPRR
ncbi:hypothetical protein FHS29_000577 [Saccharothrix tamanrassetensis]|uniref:Uncharacterized protein n=1 Tax=Saccharothrix tamanrassetensis TaxID=1051531 RepID=A0A841CCV7_9PSEU|nr:hypothetical protein [Saccharothrix tamanrassetensis]MBB5954007.1 hypothetical protein [Saccharothrix tamanrassetensis]